MTDSLSPESKVRRHAPIVLLCAGVFALIGWVSTQVFLSFPFCMDEYNYLYQAKIFAMGHRFLTIPESYRSLAELYMVTVGPRLFSKYAPLWSMVLSIGERMSLAAFVNPFLSAITVFIVYRTARLSASVRHSFLAALLLGTNPYFIGYGASYFSQPLALTLSAAALYFYAEYELSPSFMLAAVMGAFAGVLALSRPADGFCLAAALAVGFFWRPEDLRFRLKAIAVMGAVSLVGVAVLVAYNHSLTGQWRIATYTLDTGQLYFLGDPGEKIPSVSGIMMQFFVEIFTAALPNLLNTLKTACWMYPILLLLGTVTSVRGFRRVVLLHISFLVGLYHFHAGEGWPQYGARYWYPGLAGLAVLGADGLDWLERRADRGASLNAALITVVLQISCLAGTLLAYQLRFDVAMATQADIFKRFPRPGVVALVNPGSSLWWDHVDRYTQWNDFCRNPFMKGPHYYTLLGRKETDEVRLLFPELPYGVYRFDFYDRLAGRTLPPVDPHFRLGESK
jgi:hypothetical protein